MEYTITGANIVALAVAVWFIGTFINKKGPGGAAGYGDLTAWPLALMAARSERFR